MRFLLAIGLLFAALGMAQAQDTAAITVAPDDKPIAGTGAKLEGLDKITARVFSLDVGNETTGVYEALQVTVKACYAAADTDLPERAAFLEITEAKPGAAPAVVFSGWMFASSPSVSAMEHPVYDIWVVDCLGLPSEGDETATEETAPVEGATPPTDSNGQLLD